MSATITDLREVREMKKRLWKLYAPASAWPPISAEHDPCFGKEGTVVCIKLLKEGPHVGKWLYTLRFETTRGYIMHGYFEEELKFPE